MSPEYSVTYVSGSSWSIVSRGEVPFQEMYLDSRFLFSDPIPAGNAVFY
jgi:hypothetical protein